VNVRSGGSDTSETFPCHLVERVNDRSDWSKPNDRERRPKLKSFLPPVFLPVSSKNERGVWKPPERSGGGLVFRSPARWDEEGRKSEQIPTRVLAGARADISGTCGSRVGWATIDNTLVSAVVPDTQ